MASEWGSKITTTEEFVVMLSQSMKLLSYFFTDRNTVIDGTALPEREKQILKSSDPAKINKLLAKYLPPGTKRNYSVVANGHDIFNCTSHLE